MQIDKQQILSMLTSAGQQDKAAQADSQLPDQVDTDQHQGILDKLGIDVSSLLGGGDGGGLGGLAGKIL